MHSVRTGTVRSAVTGAVTSAEAAEAGLAPIAFIATTVNRYEPAAGSVMAYDRVDAASTGDEVCPSTCPAVPYWVAVTTYPVIAEPPVDAGGVQRAVAVIAPPAVPEAAVPMTGAPGTVAAGAALGRAGRGRALARRPSRR